MFESILLVEDEAALRATLGDRLRGEGYVVDTAVDGLEATEKATSQPFDLIILDLMLPSRSGLDVCRDIRQAGMATPILILTARDQTTDKVVGLKLGADDYVTKPFEAAELIARIEALLRRVPIKVREQRFHVRNCYRRFGAMWRILSRERWTLMLQVFDKSWKKIRSGPNLSSRFRAPAINL